MIHARRILLGALAALTLSAAAPSIAFSQGAHTTANGRTVYLPDPRSLDCSSMNRVLAEIDRTNYRTGPAPTNQRDMRLFNYERRVAAQRYRRCARR